MDRQKNGWMIGWIKQIDGWLEGQKKIDGYKNGRLD